MVWETQPELFLHVPYYSGGTIYTKRCLDMTNTVPLTRDDFDDEFLIPPNDYKKYLVKSRWSQSHFKRFIDYISPNHYLVNCQGLVFLEVFPFDYKEDIAASKPIYVRLFDVIDLTKYGFSKRPKMVPPRTIKYLVDGFDAKVEDHPPVVTDSSDDEDDNDDEEEDFGDIPQIDPSWITYHPYGLTTTEIWNKVCWTTINAIPIKANLYGLEPTRQGTNFGDDNTTNLRRDYFFGLKYPPGHFYPVKIAYFPPELVNQARFDPRVWGLLKTWRGSSTTGNIFYYFGRMLGNRSSDDPIAYISE